MIVIKDGVCLMTAFGASILSYAGANLDETVTFLHVEFIYRCMFEVKCWLKIAKNLD